MAQKINIMTSGGLGCGHYSLGMGRASILRPTTTMASLAPHLKSLVNSLSHRPVDAQTLGSLIQNVLDESKDKVSPDNWKSQWEYLLKNEVFILAVRLFHCMTIPAAHTFSFSQATEGKALRDPDTKYYGELRDKLDLVLSFAEHGSHSPILAL